MNVVQLPGLGAQEGVLAFVARVGPVSTIDVAQRFGWADTRDAKRELERLRRQGALKKELVSCPTGGQGRSYSAQGGPSRVCLWSLA